MPESHDSTRIATRAPTAQHEAGDKCLDDPENRTSHDVRLSQLSDRTALYKLLPGGLIYPQMTQITQMPDRRHPGDRGEAAE